jgi:hypothetical protein
MELIVLQVSRKKLSPLKKGLSSDDKNLKIQKKF